MSCKAFLVCRGYNIGAHWPSGIASNNAQGAPKQAPACEADGSSGNNIEEEQDACPTVAVVQDDSQAQQEDEAGSSDVEQPASEAEAIASCCSPKTDDASGSLVDAGFR